MASRTPLNLAYAPSHPDTRSSARVSGALYGQDLVNYITQRAQQIGLDHRAVLSVAPHEGGFQGAVGDGGTSFGPWQLHAGGALPSAVWAKGAAYAKEWANSPEGIDYALHQMAATIGGEHGPQAAADLVARFERPASQYVARESQAAMATYGGGVPGGTMPNGTVTPGRPGLAQALAANQGQHVVTQKLPVLGQALAAELLSGASTLQSGGTPNLKNMFTLAKGFMSARRQAGNVRPAPLGGTALARGVGVQPLPAQVGQTVNATELPYRNQIGGLQVKPL